MVFEGRAPAGQQPVDDTFKDSRPGPHFVIHQSFQTQMPFQFLEIPVKAREVFSDPCLYSQGFTEVEEVPG